MKKMFAFLLLTVATLNARAALFINNNASYDVFVVLWAHDATLPGPCSYYAQRINVQSGTSIAFNNVNSAGLSWGIPWQIPATLTTVGSGFDAIELVPTIEALSYGSIGGPGSCATSTTYSAAGGGYSINAAWNVFGSNVIVDINN